MEYASRCWNLKDELLYLDHIGQTCEMTARMPITDLLDGYLAGLEKRVKPDEIIKNKTILRAKVEIVRRRSRGFPIEFPK